MEETYLNIKAIYENPTANIILNMGKQSFSSMVRNKTGMSTLTIAIQHSTGSPSLSNQTTKGITGIRIGKEEANSPSSPMT